MCCGHGDKGYEEIANRLTTRGAKIEVFAGNIKPTESVIFLLTFFYGVLR